MVILKDAKLDLINKNMKTSNFKSYTGNDGVAICLYPPLSWTGPCFLNLAPDKETFFLKKSGKITEEEYRQRYRERVLNKLNPNEIRKMFKNNVLLCYEDPIFDNNDKIVNKGSGFCHRHLISEWIKETLGIDVDEWNPGDEILKNLSSSSALF